ncbi:MAG: ANTAR domain-containing protein [Mycobacterium sp.]
MREQSSFEGVAANVAPESSDAPLLLLDPQLCIRGVNTAYLRATLRDRAALIGEYLFDAFPDDPADAEARGTYKLSLSLETVMSTGRTHNMWVQRYDIEDPAAPGTFIPKVWSPRNTPVFDHGELVGVVHRVDEVIELHAALSAMADAIAADDALDPAEQLHTLAAFAASLPADRERQRALAAENEQLRRALASRDIIGQAKGILMEQYGIDADAAFGLLVRLSQESNTRLVEIARRLVELDHPPPPAA